MRSRLLHFSGSLSRLLTLNESIITTTSCITPTASCSTLPISLKAFSPPPLWSTTPAHRHFSSQTTSTATSTLTAASNNSLLEKHVIYRGRGIRLFRVLVRLKIFQLSGVAALAVPITTFLSNGEVGPYQTVIAAALVTGSAAASTALWYFSRRYVGELSLLLPQKQCSDKSGKNDKNNKSATAAAGEKGGASGAIEPTPTTTPIITQTVSPRSTTLKDPRVRFSVLDFWGNRENVDVDVSDIVPPLEGLQPAVATLMASEPALPVHVTGDRKFILSLRYGRVLDGVALRALLEGRKEDLAGMIEERQRPPPPPLFKTS